VIRQILAVSFRRNIPLFIAFRVLFNARFYYPVIGVLFLDLGLTIEQYTLLNVIWAVSIVGLELPSGALADLIGRRRMVVLASGLMVAEMAIFAFAPSGNPSLLFWLLALNRILSGAAEACASGADEALAYDSLDPEGRDDAWAKVLESLMRWKSAAFVVAMLVGAAIFDAHFLDAATHSLGLPWHFAQHETTRFPVYLTLGMAALCLLVALALREPPGHGTSGEAPTASAALKTIIRGGKWVLASRRIFLFLLAAILIDSAIRLFLTFASNYYRLIALPEFVNGILGSALALLGFAAAPLARHLVSRHGPRANLAAIAAAVLIGLCGVALATPLFGVWVLLPLGLAMSVLQFHLSYYLNLWTDSGLRATVLSFRGVAMNLAYGAAGLLYAGLSGSLRSSHPGFSENQIFGATLPWLPATFALGCLLLWFIATRGYKPSEAR